MRRLSLDTAVGVMCVAVRVADVLGAGVEQKGPPRLIILIAVSSLDR